MTGSLLALHPLNVLKLISSKRKQYFWPKRSILWLINIYTTKECIYERLYNIQQKSVNEEKLPEHKLTEGVLTLQIVGSLRALLISSLTPYCSVILLPSSWHKQMGLLSNNPASSGQQFLSGVVKLLPFSTYVKQSLMLSRGVKQSFELGSGAEGPMNEKGAGADDGPEPENTMGAGVGACADTVEIIIAVPIMAMIFSADIFFFLRLALSLLFYFFGVFRL